MNYKQAIKWGKKHPKGTRQPILMSTNSGFWPSGAWLETEFWPYLSACKAANVQPIECEKFYRFQVNSRIHRTPEDYAAMTKAGTI